MKTIFKAMFLLVALNGPVLFAKDEASTDSLLVYKYSLTSNRADKDANKESSGRQRYNGYFIANYNGTQFTQTASVRYWQKGREKAVINENPLFDELKTYGDDTKASSVFLATYYSDYAGDSFAAVAGTAKKLRLSGDKTFFIATNLTGVYGCDIQLAADQRTCSDGKLRLRFDKTMTMALQEQETTTVQAAVDTIVASFSDDGFAIYDPSAVDDTVGVTVEDLSDKTLAIDILANDTDPYGFTFGLAEILSGPEYGSIKVDDDNNVIYRIDSWDGFTEDTFSYKIMNSQGGIDTATVTVTMEYPSAADDVVYGAPNKTVEISVLANDSDPYDSMLTIVDYTNPEQGNLHFEDNLLFYTPETDFVGKVTFTYTIRDSYNLSATGLVTIWIDQPDAVDDSFSINQDETVQLDVLANDSDPAGLDLSVTGYTEPENGTLSLSENVFTYTPNSGFQGKDSFTYTISNGQDGVDTAQVTIAVGEGSPDAADDVAYTTTNTTVAVVVLANDSDPKGLALTLSSVGEPSQGAVVIENNLAYYTPNTGFQGKDSFSYTIANSEGKTASASVTVYVDIPNAVDDSAYARVNKSVNIDVLANDTDPNGFDMSIVDYGSPSHGSIVLDGSTFTYTPQTDFIGTDSFTYSIDNDHGAYDSAKVTIEVSDTPIPDSWTLSGSFEDENLGYTVAMNGDVNGDGYDDMLIAAPAWGGNGYVKLFYGSDTGPSATADWTYSCDQSGAFPGFVNYAGDINKDGYDDVIIGIPLYDTSGGTDAGRAVAFYGSASGLSSTPDWTYDFGSASARFGRSVNSAGDVNGDGYDDVIIGAPWYSEYTGKAFLFYGSADGIAGSPGWDGRNNESASQFGFSVAHADVNKDGYDDLLITAKNYTNAYNAEGAAYMYLGSATGPGSTADWMFESKNAGSEMGFCIRSVGDVNKDGREDIAIGGWLSGYTKASQGSLYVFYSSLTSATGLGEEPDVRLDGDQEGVFFGLSFSAGDLNKDGYSDIVVSAPAYSAFKGKAYIHHGSESGLESSAFWSKEGDVYGDLGYGNAIGDVNGDGYMDLIISAPYYKSGTNERVGAVYLYYGRFDSL